MTEHLDKALEAVTTMDPIAVPPGAKEIHGHAMGKMREQVSRMVLVLGTIHQELNMMASVQEEPDIVLARRTEFVADALLSLRGFVAPDDEINTGQE